MFLLYVGSSVLSRNWLALWKDTSVTAKLRVVQMGRSGEADAEGDPIRDGRKLYFLAGCTRRLAAAERRSVE